MDELDVLQKNMTRMILFAILPFLVSCEENVNEQRAKEITQEEYSNLLAKELQTSRLRYATLDSVDRKTIPYLKDFLTIYPDSIIQYLSFAETDFPGLSVTTTLYNRYQFNMRIPVKYSDDNTMILSYGLPKCHLLEISSIETRDNGAGGKELHGYSGGDLQKHFGDKEWQALFKSNGDFSILGYTLNKDKPVADFNLFIKSLEIREHKLK